MALYKYASFPFPIPLRVGGWVSLREWLHMNTVYPRTVTHLSTNRARRRATSTTPLQLRQCANQWMQLSLCISSSTLVLILWSIAANRNDYFYDMILLSVLSTHADRQGVDIVYYVFFGILCVYVCSVTWVKLAASNFLHGGLSASKAGNHTFSGTLLPSSPKSDESASARATRAGRFVQHAGGMCG